jgi:hypothetical protein
MMINQTVFSVPLRAGDFDPRGSREPVGSMSNAVGARPHPPAALDQRRFPHGDG